MIHTPLQQFFFRCGVTKSNRRRIPRCNVQQKKISKLTPIKTGIIAKSLFIIYRTM